jgi:hypothetical protein
MAVRVHSRRLVLADHLLESFFLLAARLSDFIVAGYRQAIPNFKAVYIYQ